MWQIDQIKTRKGPMGTVYTCKVCGHPEYNRDKSSRAWGRIVQHVTQEHSEKRTINGETR